MQSIQMEMTLRYVSFWEFTGVEVELLWPLINLFPEVVSQQDELSWHNAKQLKVHNCVLAAVWGIASELRGLKSSYMV